MDEFYGEMRNIANGRYTLSENMIQRALDEATFYGKNKNLLQCEKILENMVKLGHENKVTSDAFVDNMYKLSKLLGSTFGFTEFSINSSCIQVLIPQFLISANMPGGCTMCHSVYYKYAKLMTSGGPVEVIDFDKNHRGVAFKSGCKYSMSMFLGTDLFKYYGEYSLTAEEILAVILHEIGHNFYVGPVRELTAELIYMLSFKSLIDLVQSTMFVVVLQEYPKIIDSYMSPEGKKAITKISVTLGNIITSIFPAVQLYSVLMNFSALMSLVAGSLVLAWDRIIVDSLKTILHYDSEKYSDAFATSYGYGTALSIGLAKMRHFRWEPTASTKELQTIADIMMGLNRLMWMWMDNFTDPHPNDEQRMKNQIKYMESAASSITDPKLRKEYQAEMSRLYAARNEMRKYVGPNGIKANQAIVANIQDILHIEDPRELISAFRNEKYVNIDME